MFHELALRDHVDECETGGTIADLRITIAGMSLMNEYLLSGLQCLTRIFHELSTATADMGILPGVLGSRTLRRTVQVHLGYESLRLPGGTPIFTVS